MLGKINLIVKCIVNAIYASAFSNQQRPYRDDFRDIVFTNPFVSFMRNVCSKMVSLPCHTCYIHNVNTILIPWLEFPLTMLILFEKFSSDLADHFIPQYL